MRCRLLALLLFSLTTLSLLAQKEQKVVGEYEYVVPSNVSLDVAKRTALERAQVEAIATAFGTVVSQSNTTFVENKNGESSVGMFSLGGSDVRGEWVETIGEPRYDISYDSRTGFQVVKVRVQGRIREFVHAAIDLKAKVLCNGTEDRFESSDFHSGDDLYLSFLSPVSGSLAVYLIDMQQEAYCLLPYAQQTDGTCAIRAGKPYVFFHRNSAPQSEQGFVDEYTMTCDDLAEQNLIYIIFSPNAFTKAADQAANGLPRTLHYADFQRWLEKCRKRDKDMQISVVPISITKK